MENKKFLKCNYRGYNIWQMSKMVLVRVTNENSYHDLVPAPKHFYISWPFMTGDKLSSVQKCKDHIDYILGDSEFAKVVTNNS